MISSGVISAAGSSGMPVVTGGAESDVSTKYARAFGECIHGLDEGKEGFVARAIADVEKFSEAYKLASDEEKSAMTSVVIPPLVNMLVSLRHRQPGYQPANEVWKLVKKDILFTSQPGSAANSDEEGE